MRMHVVLAVFEGCPRGWLDDPPSLGAALDAAVAAGGFSCLRTVVVPFSPHGVTACAVVGESHLALHSWPEEGTLFVDVASCSTLDSARRAVDAIGAALPEGRLASVDEREIDAAGARAAAPRPR